MLKTVLLDQVPFAVYQAGEGVPLLFVHGFPLDHTMWLEQLAEFQQGYQVIAPDLRGFGQSAGAQADAQDDAQTLTSMSEYADDLARLLDALQVDQPVTLCGLSMGGYIAWQFALKYPQKLARLVLCDTRAVADNAAGQKKRQEVAEQVLQNGPDVLAAEMPLKLFSPATLNSNHEIVEQTRTVIRNTNPQAIAAASRGMAERPDVTAQLAGFDFPALVVCGTDDAIVTVEEMRQIADKLPRAEFVEIAAAGHMAPLENPPAFNHLLRQFLAATDV